MIKNKKFQIQKEDEEDFEAFLAKLNQKRQRDIGDFLKEEEERKSPTKVPSEAKPTYEDVGYDLTQITERSKEVEDPSSSRLYETKQKN